MKKDDSTGYYINEVNGAKYAYIQKSHVWNKEKKQAETSLEYLGKIDAEGKLIPKRRKLVKADVSEDVQLTTLSQKRIGMTRLLWKISEDIKLIDILKKAYPQTWRSILSMAFYYVASGKNAAYLFSSWQEDHETPIKEEVLLSGDISNLFSNMDEGRRKLFLKEWREAATSGRPCFNDITSISSYSKDNDMIEFGYNRDHEDLPQINLGYVVDSGSKLPLYYHVHDGSISDVSTLKHVMKEGFAFNMNKLLFVMDKGFYSKSNINSMYSNNYGFIVAMSLASGSAKKAIDEVRGKIRHPGNIIIAENGEAIYAKVSEIKYWGNENYNWPCRIHVYTTEDESIGKRGIEFDKKLAECYEELNSGEWDDAHVPLYAKYFEEHEETGTNRKTYTYKEEALVDAEGKYSGYLAIVTDQVDLSSKEILDIYRAKDEVEKAFFDLKNNEDAKRLGTHNASSMKGKLFTLFISSILICELRRRMAGFEEQWSVEKIRRVLDKITFSRVKLNKVKTSKPLRGLITAEQRAYISQLLGCNKNEAEDMLFEINIS